MKSREMVTIGAPLFPCELCGRLAELVQLRTVDVQDLADELAELVVCTVCFYALLRVASAQDRVADPQLTNLTE